MSNAVLLQAFEWNLPNDGNHYRWLADSAPEFKRLGLDAVWLPPFCKATSNFDVGYGIYDLYDLGEFDQKGSVRTKYGTKADLLHAIKALQAEGLQVYADAVLNHKAGADKAETFAAVPCNPDNRMEQIGKQRDIRGWTYFDFPGRKGKYSDFIWNFNHFTGVDYDDKTGEHGVFRILGENKHWSTGVSSERGNYDYLMFADIDHEHPDVQAELHRWLDWMIRETEIDGIRFDAVKHIEDSFILDIVSSLYENWPEKNLFLFGEHWIYDPDASNHFLEQTEYKLNLFDVALHFNMHNASTSSDFDLRTIFDNSLVREHPDKVVTFVDNHDSQRGQALESWVEEWFRPHAHAIILLRQDGYPCIFFGDLYGIGGKEAWPHSHDTVAELIRLRKRYAWGDEIDLPTDDHEILAWSRSGDEEHPGGLLAILNSGGYKELEFTVEQGEPGQPFRDAMLHHEEFIRLGDKRSAVFPVKERSVSVWIPAE
ncbi:MAG: alpha-amylase [Eubacteriales bacterium]|nr:alpha-amylase [Eubacteriales bacterium]MDD4323432.1 alpha-amylase [Eubacteriales bacterium]MDD4541128.1 alpha-amylase [Eubacteriales bacterium]